MPRRTRDYWEALGKFISLFSNVELALASTIWTITTLKPPTAKALFPGIRVHDGISLLKRICAAEGWQPNRASLLEDTCQQLGQINGIRNELLHYGGEVQPSGLVEVSNRKVAYIPEKVRSVTISSEILDRMYSDLTKIQIHLIFIERPLWERSWTEVLGPVLSQPWQYKPPPSRSRSAKSPREKPSP